MFLKTDLIRTNKNHMIIFKISQKLAKKSHSKAFQSLACSFKKLSKVAAFSTTTTLIRY